MPGNRKNNRKKPARRRKSRVLPVLLTLMIVIGAFFGWMTYNARTCHLCMADVYMADLPAEMDGTKLLFVSDIDIQSPRDAKDAQRLMAKLSRLQPDALLLGGDYSALNTVDLLNDAQDMTPDYALEFASSLSGFAAPLGKFAVLGEKDADAAALGQAFTAAGVTCLSDSCARIGNGGSGVTIVGLSDYSRKQTPFTKLAGGFSARDCVIVLSHNPDAYAEIRTSEAAGGGAWADLVLSGHTLGGQIWLLDRNLRGEKKDQGTYSGWQHISDVPLLISQGLGCEGAHLRLGSRSEVWLITLRKQNRLQ